MSSCCFRNRKGMTMKKRYDLYIDESGTFNDDRIDINNPMERSMVGGVLCDPEWMTKEKMNELLPGNRVHCCSHYNKRYLNMLQTLTDYGCRLVVFENRERIKVIDTNITYINIISEGLVKVLRDLAIENKDGVEIQVVIAQRNMELKEYKNRLVEHVQMALGRNRIRGVSCKLLISDARFDKRLFFADIICNTWFTRDRRPKFTDREQADIEAVFAQGMVYPVFEDATIQYLKRVVLDGHIGEALFEICTLQNLKELKELKDQIVKELIKASPARRKVWFTQVSSQIDLYTRERMFTAGIELVNHYKQYFLSPLLEETSPVRDEAAFWCFDADFYLLTFYDHLGQISQCDQALKDCRKNLNSISRSWEHLDYYFRFCLRELNILMNAYRFREILDKADRLAETFREAKHLFSHLDFSGKEDVRSELLGKIEGMRTEALINLMAKDPSLYHEALNASVRSIEEFTSPEDLKRAWQMMCLLMVEAGNADQAVVCLLNSKNISSHDRTAFQQFLEKTAEHGLDEFSVLHYTNVMCLLQKTGNESWKDMELAFMGHAAVIDYVNSTVSGEYPWSLTVWNMSRHYMMKGDAQKAETYYRKAMMTLSAGNTVMQTFALSISAQKYLESSDHPELNEEAYRQEWENIKRKLQSDDLPVSIFDWFSLHDPDLSPENHIGLALK